MVMINKKNSSPYRYFSATEWGKLRKDTPLLLSEQELARLRGYGETISLEEVKQIYLPLSQLLNFYVRMNQELSEVTNMFLGQSKKIPYIICIAGSVAVGKSTTSRILKTLLSRWSNHPNVALVPTDGFLFSNKVLEKRGLMDSKGFPESFDLSALLTFLTLVKGGEMNLIAPVYSHIYYDIRPDQQLHISSPDILIIEGLNVLQPASLKVEGLEIPYVSDFFDFSIYIDADENVIKEWYIDRFLSLRHTGFREKGAYFRRYASLDDEEARQVATDIWERINYVNLKKNILPTRGRADLILQKSEDHKIDNILLRRI